MAARSRARPRECRYCCANSPQHELHNTHHRRLFRFVGTTGELVINFTNYGPVTADIIRFHVQYGDQSLFIRDVGTFSPGIEITHKFKWFEGDLQLSPLLQGHKPVMCDVAWSHFTNGTIWPAPVPPPQTSVAPSPALRLLAISPSDVVVEFW
jgi:hypothetical protein